MHYSLFFLAIFLVFIGCKKPEEPTVETYYIDSEMYAYALFPTGSWWVYKDEGSGLKDSVAITYEERYINTYLFSTDYYYESHDINIYSTRKGNGWGGVDAYLKGTHGVCYYTERFSKNPSISSTDKYVSSISVGDTMRFVQGRAIAKQDVFNEYEVNGEYYNKVVIFDLLQIDDIVRKEYTLLNRYYFSRGIGLIKEEDYTTGKTWTLINYHINR